MAQRQTAQSRATQATAEALIEFRVEAQEDGVVSPTEGRIIELLETAYDLNSVQDLADELTAQLRRIPDVAPNRPMLERIREVERVWTERKKTFGSDSAAKRRHLVDFGEDDAA